MLESGHESKKAEGNDHYSIIDDIEQQDRLVIDKKVTEGGEFCHREDVGYKKYFVVSATSLFKGVYSSDK